MQQVIYEDFCLRIISPEDVVWPIIWLRHNSYFLCNVKKMCYFQVSLDADILGKFCIIFACSAAAS